MTFARGGPQPSSDLLSGAAVVAAAGSGRSCVRLRTSSHRRRGARADIPQDGECAADRGRERPCRRRSRGSVIVSRRRSRGGRRGRRRGPATKPSVARGSKPSCHHMPTTWSVPARRSMRGSMPPDEAVAVQDRQDVVAPAPLRCRARRPPRRSRSRTAGAGGRGPSTADRAGRGTPPPARRRRAAGRRGSPPRPGRGMRRPRRR